MLKIFFGKRGSGKTTLIRRDIQNLPKPVVIIDILGNFDPEKTDLGNDESWEFTDVTSDAIFKIATYVKDKKSSGIIVVQPSQIEHCVNFICSTLVKIGGGTIVLDEGDAISMPAAPVLDDTIRYGRNKNVHLVFGCRRPAEIHRNVTAGADIAYILTTQEPRDIEYYCDFLESKEIAQQLPRLQPHHGIFRDFTNKKIGYFKAEIDGTIIELGEIKTKDSKPSEMENKNEITHAISSKSSKTDNSSERGGELPGSDSKTSSRKPRRVRINPALSS